MSYWIMGISAAAMIAGTAAQNYGAAKQARQANAVLNAALLQSQQDTDKTAAQLMQAIEDYDTDNRQEQQQALEKQTFERMVEPVNESQISRASEQGRVGDVSADYEAAKADADAKSLTDLIADAHRKSAVMGAQRLRQSEGYKLADIGADINQRTRNTNANMNIANNQAQAIMNKTNGYQIGGQLASLIGQAGMMYGPTRAMNASVSRLQGIGAGK